MDGLWLLVAVLVIGAPLALFLSLRPKSPGTGEAAASPSAKPSDRIMPPADYGLGREDSPRSAATADADSEAGRSPAAAAAAAGGALILAAGFAHRHASEGGGESPNVGETGGGPDSGGGADGGGDAGGGDGGGE